MQEERIRWLICQHLDQNCSADETGELESLMQEHPELRQLIDRLSQEETLGQDLRDWASFQPQPNQDRLRQLLEHHQAPLRRRRKIRNCILAAATLAFVTLLLVYWPPTHRTFSPEITVFSSQEPAPGRNHAFLILNGGKPIDLDSLPTGPIAGQQHPGIIKADSASLVYNNITTKLPQKPTEIGQYNILQTPRGGQYAITLSDQTKVWLNNSSSLRYPAHFAGANRTVELKGEGYFEISPQPSAPFRVITGEMTIDVLGTRFVVNAYPEDQQTTTTLIDGKVRVNMDNMSATLIPGDQLTRSSKSAGDSTKLLHDADLDAALAWKEGYFHFSHAHLATILRQIARWYDLDVTIPANMPDHIYNGEIDRRLRLSVVLDFLSKPDVRLSVHDKKLIISISPPDQ